MVVELAVVQNLRSQCTGKEKFDHLFLGSGIEKSSHRLNVRWFQEVFESYHDRILNSQKVSILRMSFLVEARTRSRCCLISEFILPIY